jgi:hypothetical protein
MKLFWERDSAAGWRMSVQGVLPQGPADKAGVSTGDEILGVAGEAVLGKNLEKVAALLTGVAGSTVELTVVSKGGAPRSVVVTRQVLTQPEPAKGKASSKTAFQQKDAPANGAGKGPEDRSVGAGDSRTATRPVSTSSDASFVHVEGSWEDCFAALAHSEYAGKAAERLEAAVRAWRTGTDPRGTDPRACDARLLHFFAAWARELDAADVQQVPAGGDAGVPELTGEGGHTCGLRTRSKAAPTALLVLSCAGRSKEGRGASGGERIVVHLHASASHVSPAVSTAPSIPRAASGDKDGIDEFEHISLSEPSPNPATIEHSDNDGAQTQGTENEELPSISVDGIASGLVSAVSWILAIEACKKNAAPLPSAITLLIEGASEFALGSPTLRRLAPHILTPSPPSPSRTPPARKDTRGNTGGGAGVPGGAESGRGARACIPGSISLVTLSGVNSWVSGYPTVCHGVKGSLRLVVDLQLRAGAAAAADERGEGAEEATRSPKSHAKSSGCYHSGYMGGMMKDPVSVLAAVLFKLNKQLLLAPTVTNSQKLVFPLTAEPLNVFVDKKVSDRYKTVFEHECARRARDLAAVPGVQQGVQAVGREWLGPALCLRRICGVAHEQGAHSLNEESVSEQVMYICVCMYMYVYVCVCVHVCMYRVYFSVINIHKYI